MVGRQPRRVRRGGNRDSLGWAAMDEAALSRIEELTDTVESFQIADWIRFVPEHEVQRFLGEVSSAAIEGEFDGDTSRLASVLTDWIAIAEMHARDAGPA